MLRLLGDTQNRQAAPPWSTLFRPLLAQIRKKQLARLTRGRRSGTATREMITQDDLLRTAAAEVLEMRRRREEHFPFEVVGDAGWDLLLFAFQSEEPLQSKALILATRLPDSTAKRLVEVLEHLDLLHRVGHPTRFDRRAVFYQLTPGARAKVGKALGAMLRD